MRIFGLEIGLARKEGASIETVLRRIMTAYQTKSGSSVTPENAMQAPTVQAIVTAISRRIATLPIKVTKKTTNQGRERRELQPNHPVAKLLRKPNDWQDANAFWLDAVSCLVRYGNFVAFKSRGSTGPIRQLIPLPPRELTARQDENWSVTYEQRGGSETRIYTADQVMHARGASRDFLWGDSPVVDIREAIGLEIAAEAMGASVFGNMASPGIVFTFADGFQGFKTDEEHKKFQDDFQKNFASKGRFSSMLLPKGIGLSGTQLTIDNDKAQFLATRQYQRSVIAGAFGVPPHLVGELSKGTYNNVEQQSLDFVMNVVLPFIRMLEAAMERSLLTDEDRRDGISIRFNLEGALRGDFKTRQEGLKIQREMGVINPNDWRELEGQNPISAEDGGETYWVKGPSGQGDDPAGATADTPPPPNAANDDEQEDEASDARDA